MDTLEVVSIESIQMALFLNKKQPTRELFLTYIKKVWFKAGWEALGKAGDFVFLSSDQTVLKQGCNSIIERT